jgi:hypothetical protein
MQRTFVCSDIYIKDCLKQGTIHPSEKSVLIRKIACKVLFQSIVASVHISACFLQPDSATISMVGSVRQTLIFDGHRSKKNIESCSLPKKNRILQIICKKKAQIDSK